MTLSVGSDPDVDFHQEPGIDPSLSFDFHWAASCLSMNLSGLVGELVHPPCLRLRLLESTSLPEIIIEHFWFIGLSVSVGGILLLHSLLGECLSLPQTQWLARSDLVNQLHLRCGSYVLCLVCVCFYPNDIECWLWSGCWFSSRTGHRPFTLIRLSLSRFTSLNEPMQCVHPWVLVPSPMLQWLWGCIWAPQSSLSKASDQPNVRVFCLNEVTLEPPPRCPLLSLRMWDEGYLVDPASSHMLVSKTKPCMSKYKPNFMAKLRMAH